MGETGKRRYAALEEDTETWRQGDKGTRSKRQEVRCKRKEARSKNQEDTETWRQGDKVKWHCLSWIETFGVLEQLESQGDWK